MTLVKFENITKQNKIKNKKIYIRFLNCIVTFNIKHLTVVDVLFRNHGFHKFRSQFTCLLLLCKESAEISNI